MLHSIQLIFLLVVLLGLAACQDSGSDDAGAASNSPSPSVALFDKEMSKKGCELLSAELVSKTFDIAADVLRQTKIMGCRYDWSSDQDTVETGISMIRVYKSETAAAQWLATATRNKTAEEMQAEMEQVSRKVDQREELNTELKKSTAKSLLAMVDSEAISFEDVAGVGDEARVRNDGTVYVRKNNVTFMVSAYKGATAPPLEMQGVEIKQMVKVAKDSAKKWAIETAPQRKKDGARLAKAIIERL